MAPFHWTTEEDTKLVPFAVRVNWLPPAGVVVGLMEVRVGKVGTTVVNWLKEFNFGPGIGVHLSLVNAFQ